MITKQALEDIYAKYHRPEYLKIDPLLCVHRFKGKGREALEAVGIMAAALAYGRVEIIVRNINVLIDDVMGGDPVAFVNGASYKGKVEALAGFKHRFNDGVDIAALLEAAKSVTLEYGSLEKCFCGCMAQAGVDVKSGIRANAGGGGQFRDILTLFTDKLRDAGRKHCGGRASFEHLIPSPRRGSACKRMVLYLRWMARKDDGIDLGAWKSVPASMLLVPVDTHVAQIARGYGLTKRNSADWKMAEEITAALRAFDPSDPVRYDFAICHAGMVGFRG
ncbi:MAG: TIGR02757 family protein [Chitinispirillales bacterium]|jgi:uncharacterized protein (TIGR02757 family)|nr:TIGR02757 family protein [Chitinispirillales bacterium]